MDPEGSQMKKKQPQTPMEQFSAIGAHMVSQEFVMSCLLETIAQRQPAIGEALLLKIEESISTHPIDEFPGLRERIDKYVNLLRSQTAKKPQ
jgi:hypothetical protein